MMYIAYSAIRQQTGETENGELKQPETEVMIRYEAYQAACQKYSREIADIQKYFPGWTPVFR